MHKPLVCKVWVDGIEEGQHCRTLVSPLEALAPATFILSLALCMKFLVPCFMDCIVVNSAILAEFLPGPRFGHFSTRWH